MCQAGAPPAPRAVGGVDAVHVGVDLAPSGEEGGGERDPVVSEARQLVMSLVVDALEAGHHDHVAVGEVAPDVVSSIARMRALDIGVVGEDAHLEAGVALRLDAQPVQREPRSPMETCSPVEAMTSIARGSGSDDLLREGEQAVRFAGHWRRPRRRPGGLPSRTARPAAPLPRCGRGCPWRCRRTSGR